MKILAAVWLIVSLVACATFSLDTGSHSIQQMKSPEGICTAWAVGKHRWLTARHCMEMASGWTIAGVAADPIAADPFHDIALVSGPEGAVILIAEEPPPIGATVQTLGYGLGQADLLSFPAIVLAYESPFFRPSLPELLVSGANGMPGMSGGPILYRGRAVSMITGGGPATSAAHLLGTGVPWVHLSAFTQKYVGR
jgi:hypothetical protein